MNPLAALALAAGLALVGWALGWLSAGGAWAAGVVGTVVFGGAGPLGALWLALFFISGSLLGDRPVPGTGAGARAPGDGRRASQVIANGCWPAVGGALILAGLGIGWSVMAGALAAATADTWATEIGRRAPHPPRLITTGHPVPAGTSGGITLLGTAAGAAGATAFGALVWITHEPRTAVAAAIAGVLAMLGDSLLGASLQATYFCESCGSATEVRHGVGHVMRRVRGLPWLDNDAVNLLANGVGAAAAVLLA